MKKNILLIPSLVLCSFIALPALAMEEASNANEYHPITTATTGDILADYPELEHILGDLPELPEPQASTHEEQVNTMLQSVMLPTSSKKMGLTETVRDYVCSNIRNTIAYLSNQTFDVENQRHFDILNAAIQEAINNEDVSSLTTILALCRSTDLYKTKIRINCNPAQSAYNFLTSDTQTTRYNLSVQLANKRIEAADQQYTLEYNKKTEAFNKALAQLSATHRKDITALAENFSKLQESEIEPINAPMANLAALNKHIRSNAENFVATHPMTKQEAKNASLTEIRLNRLDAIKMDAIKMPKIEILELTDNK